MKEEKTKSKMCPFGLISQSIIGLIAATTGKSVECDPTFATFSSCIEANCGMWLELHPATSREDHSGGKEAIFTEGVRTHRTPRHEGPGGCTGTWILDASGRCGLISEKQK